MSEEVIIQIDTILKNVGASSLTQNDINFINLNNIPFETNQDKFNIAVKIVELRNIYGSYQAKLKNYALSNGLKFTQQTRKPFSNVFIGARVE